MYWYTIVAFFELFYWICILVSMVKNLIIRSIFFLGGGEPGLLFMYSILCELISILLLKLCVSLAKNQSQDSILFLSWSVRNLSWHGRFYTHTNWFLWKMILRFSVSKFMNMYIINFLTFYLIDTMKVLMFWSGIRWFVFIITDR